MFFVRLSELRRTSGFRLSLLFFALFGAASLVLFGFIFWQTAGFLSNSTDDWLRSVVAAADGMGTTSERLRELRARAIADPKVSRPIAVFDVEGHWLGGSPITLPAQLPPTDKPFEFTQQRDDRTIPFRGMLHRYQAGDFLLVAQDMREARQLSDRLIEAMALSGLGVLVLGLAGAALAGANALGRIDGVTCAIERIINGNLSERLPGGTSNSDLDRLIRVVNRMLSEIERLMQEVKGVTDEIAHDLRTPLTRLLAVLERASRRASSAEEYSVAIDEAIAETRSILATFSALLRIAEVESGARRAGFMTADLVGVAADVVDFYEPLAERRAISLSLETPPLAVELQGDPSLLFEAVGNLVDNAIKFTPPEGHVTIRVFDGEDGIGIDVRDTGPGIPETERNLVLRRLHRGERSRHTPGSGLGLSLVAAVAKLHGLNLAIEDGNPGCQIRLWRTRPDQAGAGSSETAQSDASAEPGLSMALR